jgi:hypothetical protein
MQPAEWTWLDAVVTATAIVVIVWLLTVIASLAQISLARWRGDDD